MSPPCEAFQHPPGEGELAHVPPALRAHTVPASASLPGSLKFLHHPFSLLTPSTHPFPSHSLSPLLLALPPLTLASRQPDTQEPGLPGPPLAATPQPTHQESPVEPLKPTSPLVDSLGSAGAPAPACGWELRGEREEKRCKRLKLGPLKNKRVSVDHPCSL